MIEITSCNQISVNYYERILGFIDGRLNQFLKSFKLCFNGFNRPFSLELMFANFHFKSIVSHNGHNIRKYGASQA